MVKIYSLNNTVIFWFGKTKKETHMAMEFNSVLARSCIIQLLLTGPRSLLSLSFRQISLLINQ